MWTVDIRRVEHKMKGILPVLVIIIVLFATLSSCAKSVPPTPAPTSPPPLTPESTASPPVPPPESIPVPEPTPTPKSPEPSTLESASPPSAPAPEPTPTPIPKPIADFTYEGKYAGEEIHFINESQNALKWLWNFGDGSPESKEENPRHIYQTPGAYKVEFFAANLGGGVKTFQRIMVLEKNGASLLKIEVEAISIPAPVEGETWRGYIGTILFLADEGIEVLTPYIKWANEPRSSSTPASFRSWRIRSIDYGSPSILTVFVKLKKATKFHVTCYLEYKDSEGVIKKSNEVSTDLYVE